MAGKWTLALEQGATCRFTFVWSFEDGVDGNGDPVYTPHDLTGCTARMQIRQKPGTAVLAEATTENGGITLGTTDGTVSVFMSDAQTDAVNVRKARYDIEIQFPSGDVKRVLEGPVTNSLNITQVGA